MLKRYASEICLCCRLTLDLDKQHPALRFNEVQRVIRRYRSTSKRKTPPKYLPSAKPARKPPSFPASSRLENANNPFSEPLKANLATVPQQNLELEDCVNFFKNAVKAWSESQRTYDRFKLFGWSKDDIKPLLAAYVDAATSGFFSSKTKRDQYHLSRFGFHLSPKQETRQTEAEIIFSNIFFAWCHNTEDSGVLDELVKQGKVNPDVLISVRYLAEVVGRRLAEEFPFTRTVHRKIIMHVGPTNSGKTHHALRALAAAKTGVYAGPLRLLAHEIWERLNLGQIVPLGVDEQPPLATSTNPPPIKSQAHKPQNPQYARLTNMVTGEEQKIVDVGSGLLSCTVEMLPMRSFWDVGVVDEIQLIGDPQRGFAWTHAVLGLCAKEVHLCGEESAIPVVEALLKETGDELEVRRYERLTQLSVEKASLDGDLAKVQKGDCVVAFSRSRIFAIKTEIEKKTNLRCAVVYGKLPPEIRSEQAALFNDPNSGYDVIIGSDAIGMGLNLKIRRIVFDTLSKRNALGRPQPLSVSQVKQIAGRAGRYGQTLAGETPGGFTTTLHESDLPYLHVCLAERFAPLHYAHISSTGESVERVATALPENTTFEAIQMAHIYASNLPPIYRYAIPSSLSELCHFIDTHSRGQLTWPEKNALLVAPIAWRDELCLQAAIQMVRMHRDHMNVKLHDAIDRFGFLPALHYAEGLMERDKPALASSERSPQPYKEGILEMLESFHKVLVYYMWMHFRSMVVYNQKEEAEVLKSRVELALDWGLQVLGRRQVEKGKELSSVLNAGWRAKRREMRSQESRNKATVPSDRLLDSKPKWAWERAPDLSQLLKKYVDELPRGTS